MKKIIEYIGDREKLAGFVKEHRDMLIRAVLVACAITAALFVFASPDDDEKKTDAVKENTVAVESETAKIVVDIGGEVISPMVVELDEGSRVGDAIEAAGGVTENADLTDINRAAFVEDGEKIYIPPAAVDGTGEDEDASSSGQQVSRGDGRININTADSAQLQELDGIGPATAQKIIDYRKENGRFSSIEDIKNVSGIGDKSFEKIKDRIKV